MTEKKKYMTAYQMRVDDPEAEKAKKASKRLYKELCDKIGVDAMTGCGIGLNSSDDGPALRVYLLSDEHLKDVPDFFEGFEVVTKVTGPVVALGAI